MGRPGSFGHEELDAKTFAAWGVDYVKEDSCDATGDHNASFEQYGKMRDALNRTGRPIYFDLCGWSCKSTSLLPPSICVLAPLWPRPHHARYINKLGTPLLVRHPLPPLPFRRNF